MHFRVIITQKTDCDVSLIGRISNKLLAYSPRTQQELFSHRKIKLHTVDPQLLAEHDRAVREVGHTGSVLPREDTIVYSHKVHRGTVLPQQQANYNEAVSHVKQNAKDLADLCHQRDAITHQLKRNPYNKTQLTTLRNIQHNIATKIVEKDDLAQELRNRHQDYYYALHGRAAPESRLPAIVTPACIEGAAEPSTRMITYSPTREDASLQPTHWIAAEADNERPSESADNFVAQASNESRRVPGDDSIAEAHHVEVYETTLPVDGMVCGACEKSVSKLISALPGVITVAVSHLQGNAIITHTPEVNSAALTSAVENSGNTPGSPQTILKSKPRGARRSATQNPTEPSADDPDPADPVDMSAVAASCCGGPALGDLGKAADASNNAAAHKYDLGGALPQTPLEIGFAAATGYLGAGGALASMKTFHSYRKHVRRIDKALDAIADIRAILKVQPEDLEHLLVFERFLKQQRVDARFIQYVPGAASGTGSSLIGMGSLLAKFSPPGLMISSVDASMHVIKSTRLRKRLEKALQNIPLIDRDQQPIFGDQQNLATRQAYQAQREIIKKEMKTCELRIAGGVQTAVGTAALVPVSLAVYGASVKAAGMPLIIAGVSTLVPGIGLSLRFNPYRDLGIRSEFAKPLMKYQDHLLELHRGNFPIDFHAEKAIISRLFDQEAKLEQGLRTAKKRIALAQRYKTLHQQSISVWKNLGHRVQTNAIDAGAMAVFQLPERSLARIKLWNKEHIANRSGIPSGPRLATLDLFSAIHERWDGLPADRRLQTVGTCTAQSEFNALFSALERDARIRSGVMKLVAMEALSSSGMLKKRFVALFEDDQRDSLSRMQTITHELQKIRSTSPCCLADTAKIFEIIKDRFYHHPGHDQLGLTTERAQQRDILYRTLAHRCDQYIIFGIPLESESDERVYSRYLANYHALKSEKISSM